MKKNLMKVAFTVLTVILAMTILVACGASSLKDAAMTESFNNTSMSGGGSSYMPSPSPAPMAPQMDADYEIGAVVRDDMMPSVEEGEAAIDTTIKRKLIETINLTLYVDDVKASLERISDSINKSGGYIQEVSSWESNTYVNGNMVLRVPSEALADVLPIIEAEGKIRNYNRSTDDVTERYYDRQARMNNLQAQEKRYLEILAQAETVQEVLEVERELVYTREQIEVLAGQLRYMDNQVAYSTIHLELREEKVLVESEKPSILKSFDAAKVAFRNSINMILTTISNLIIFVGFLIPLLPFVLVAAYLYYRFIYKKNKSLRAAYRSHQEAKEAKKINKVEKKLAELKDKQDD